MAVYITEENLSDVFDVVAHNYARVEEVPDYQSEFNGLGKLQGVLAGVQQDLYYPDILDKAVYLLMQINKGHFFSNGNKRLALAVTVIFLDLNGMQFKNDTKEDYKQLLSTLFAERHEWQDFPDFSATDFAAYHLSIVIAESGKYEISFDELKDRVKKFLVTITEKVV